MRTLLLLSLTATIFAATPPTVKTAEPIEISRLNDCIQLRFLDRKAFGINRIGSMPGQGSVYPMAVLWGELGKPLVVKISSAQNAGFLAHGTRIFQPENPTEQAVIDQLRQKDLEVVVYLVGRQSLAEPVTPTPRAGLQGPAAITLHSDTKLPDQVAIFSAGRTALATIGQDQGYDAKQGEWTVAMRPLRASNQGCIQCHTSVTSAPKLGDALGVVMYVYRPVTVSN
jgi:hypothetical protein